MGDKKSGPSVTVSLCDGSYSTHISALPQGWKDRTVGDPGDGREKADLGMPDLSRRDRGWQEEEMMRH